MRLFLEKEDIIIKILDTHSLCILKFCISEFLLGFAACGYNASQTQIGKGKKKNLSADTFLSNALYAVENEES